MMVLSLVALAAYWYAGRAALAREHRAASNLFSPLLAPFGRIGTLPTGSEVLVAKKWYFNPYTTREPMRVWVGWWNCRSFHPDAERYYFLNRRSRFAIPVTMAFDPPSGAAGWGV